MTSKQPFRFIRKWLDDGILRCEYEASFWEGPTTPLETGRYRTIRCEDVVRNKRFLNTSPTVSYYDQLKKACGL